MTATKTDPTDARRATVVERLAAGLNPDECAALEAELAALDKARAKVKR